MNDESRFLAGALLVSTRPAPAAGAVNLGRGPGSFVMKSETTLTCWDDCTYNISGC